MATPVVFVAAAIHVATVKPLAGVNTGAEGTKTSFFTPSNASALPLTPLVHIGNGQPQSTPLFPLVVTSTALVPCPSSKGQRPTKSARAAGDSTNKAAAVVCNASRVFRDFIGQQLSLCGPTLRSLPTRIRVSI